MKRQPVYLEEKKKAPFWKVVIAVIILAIISYRITGANSFSALLVLLLFVAVSIKLLFFALRVTSMLLKIALVVLVLIAWLGTFLS